MQNVLIDDRRIWVDLLVFFRCNGTGNEADAIPYSSQSVARLNSSWSNDPKMGPRRARDHGGFAGREDLEETRRYRADVGKGGRGEYDMVFDVPNGGSAQHRKRSRSGQREHDSSRDRRRRRSRSPVPYERSRRETTERHRRH